MTKLTERFDATIAALPKSTPSASASGDEDPDLFVLPASEDWVAIQKNDASRVVTADALRSPPLSLAVAAVSWGTRNLHSAASIARGTAEMVMTAMQDDILPLVDELEAEHESLA